VSRKGLLSIATLLEDVCTAFGASFVENLRITEFQSPLSALSHLLDLTDDPSQAASIARLPSRSRENKLQRASEVIRAARFADGRSVSSLLKAFKPSSVVPNPFTFDGTPVFSLSVPELEQLRELANELTFVDIMNRREVLENGQNLGTQFASNPAIGLLGRLLAIVRQTITLVLKKRPFTIQCLAAAGLLLVLLNKSSRKGRVAQVATGEGKSIIIALVSSVLALMNRSVDVITSSQYLAKRDEKEFRPVYAALGIVSSSIAINDPPSSPFNGRILYGTSTDFEF
jgi:hypothetical protein